MPRVQLAGDSDDDEVPTNNNNNKKTSSSNSHFDSQSYYAHKNYVNKKQTDTTTSSTTNEHKNKPPQPKIVAVENADGTDLPVKLNTKVFIDGLPFHEDSKAGNGKPLQEQLAEFCSAWKVGKVTHLVKKDGQGFGYLAFRSPHSVEVAVAVLNGKKFIGHFLRVEEPKLPRSMRENYEPKNDHQNQKDYQQHHQHQQQNQQNQEQNQQFRQHKDVAGPQARSDAIDCNRQVLLSDLPPHSQPDILREVFEEYCPALEKHISKIKMTSRNRKAFVTLQEESQAQELAEFLNGFTVLGRRIEAKMAQPPGASAFAPAVLRAAAVAKEMKESTNNFEVPKGYVGADASSTTTNQKENPTTETTTTTTDATNILGSNANKHFPMPLLIDLDNNTNETNSNKQQTKTTLNSRIRQRGEEEKQGQEVQNKNTNINIKTPSNSASTTSLQNRFQMKGPRIVYVANLSSDMTEQRLRQHFGSVGKLKSCELQAQSGQYNGIGTIEFLLPADAAASVERLNGSLLGGNMIQCELDETTSNNKEKNNNNDDNVVGVFGAQGVDEKLMSNIHANKNRELDEDDLDAYARHYGVKDRKKFLESTTTDNATTTKTSKKKKQQKQDEEEEGDDEEEELPSRQNTGDNKKKQTKFGSSKTKVISSKKAKK